MNRPPARFALAAFSFQFGRTASDIRALIGHYPVVVGEFDNSGTALRSNSIRSPRVGQIRVRESGPEHSMRGIRRGPRRTISPGASGDETAGAEFQHPPRPVVHVSLRMRALQ
jgi:hypothetical protein